MRLPEGVRLKLARLSLWRRRQAADMKTSMLALCLAMLSGLLGYSLANPPNLPSAFFDENPLQLSASKSLGSGNRPILRTFPSAAQWGELQAEVLRLRLLFGKVADAAELDGGEIALGLQLADRRYLDSLSEMESNPEAVGRRFTLAKRAVDHMTTQAGLMLSISQQRQQARDFTLSGSPVVRAQITSRFGYRIDPRTGKKRIHRGLDFGGRNGSKVLALADGVVTYSGWNGGYGNLVELEHAGQFRTRYAHNEKNRVQVGDRVFKGQVIATMGSTGKSTGTHVHVEVRENGRAVDPLRFITAGS